ncbi:hypothetical protein [Nocardia asiatica]|uniref:hypothetical protein n=1 Tax=Nocardia asiatica TaxID=209252 RepID=UPI0002F11749|nr:hypothetical protein [Nocardia asiatica]
MTKNGTFTIPASYTKILSWTADTTNYPGSTVSSDGLVVQGANSSATITANIPWTASLSMTVTVRIKVNNVVVATGSGATGTSGTSTALATGQTVATGDNITVEVVSTQANFGSVSSGTNTYVRVT